MLEFWNGLVTYNQFIPHGHCYLWKPEILGLHILSDSLIALAYYSIPISLIYFVRQRQDLPFNSIFILFAAFIISCGTSHLSEIWTLWYPTYWLSGFIKALTALVSVYTSLTLSALIPKALNLPSSAQLEAANLELKKEISERQLAESALRENEDRLQMAIASAQLGTWDWNLVTGELKWDTGCKAMFGLPSDANTSIEVFFEGLHPDDRSRLGEIIQETLNPASGGVYDTEYRTIGIFDRVERWLRAKGKAYFDADGKPLRFIGTVLNITAHKEVEVQLIHDAFHDSLTRLPNRALFVKKLEQAIKQAKLDFGYRCAVLFVDVDRFKVINDSLGHLMGDKLLIAVAHRLESCLRPADTVARLGGDEFTILLNDIQDLNDIINVIEQINVNLAKTFNLDGQEVFTSASIGIALGTSSYNQPEELIRDADIAMYRAKKLGKARYEIFDSSMYAQAAELLQLETDLRRAIERQEFQLYYQPIVSLETCEIIGFEALVRWQHPEVGFIAPDKFIPLAEETGLIVPIGYWVLREACHQMHSWQLQYPNNPPLTISVNISSRQFSDANLIEQINLILQDTGLASNSLKLEITETVLMENSDSATAMLLQLQQMDIQLHLDDFGTGYSSLSYLHRFLSSALKIDRSFVSNISTDADKWAIVGAIISLANSLNIDVIAEGVETIEQLKQLQIKQCQHAQGYFFSPPLDSFSVEQLISSGLHLNLNPHLLSLSTPNLLN
ncbi:EAL domain-containing protein [Nostoc punctiforme UO1]|uniref:putative bifunctional diguanylate cyclase/phosphodiesterase n=1 Tax=Nostoc punctiforme TaxID=272131 RepID=UPI0030A627C9